MSNATRMTTMGGGYSPLSIPGLWGWWSARFPSGLSAGLPADASAVASWVDLTGNGRNLGGGGTPLFRKANPNVLAYKEALALDATLWKTEATNTATLTQAGSGASGVIATAQGSGAGYGIRHIARPACTPGQQWAGEVTVTLSTARPGKIYLLWFDSSNVFLSATAVAHASQSGAGLRFTVTGTAPASAAMVAVRYDVDDAAVVAGETFTLTSAGLYQQAAAPAAFVPPVLLPTVAGALMPGIQLAGNGPVLTRPGYDTSALQGGVTVVCVATFNSPTPALNYPRLWIASMNSSTVPGRSEISAIAYQPNVSSERWVGGTMGPGLTVTGSVLGVPDVSTYRSRGTPTDAFDAEAWRNAGSRQVGAIGAAFAADAGVGAAGSFAVGSGGIKHLNVHELAVLPYRADDGTMHRLERALAAPYGIGLS